LIQSVAKSNKGKSKPTIRKAFLSNNPGKNSLAVNSAIVEHRFAGIVELDDPLDIVSNSVIYKYKKKVDKKVYSGSILSCLLDSPMTPIFFCIFVKIFWKDSRFGYDSDFGASKRICYQRHIRRETWQRSLSLTVPSVLTTCLRKNLVFVS